MLVLVPVFELTDDVPLPGVSSGSQDPAAPLRCPGGDGRSGHGSSRVPAVRGFWRGLRTQTAPDENCILVIVAEIRPAAVALVYLFTLVLKTNLSDCEGGAECLR